LQAFIRISVVLFRRHVSSWPDISVECIQQFVPVNVHEAKSPHLAGSVEYWSDQALSVRLMR
jgi:hypothetical protein